MQDSEFSGHLERIRAGDRQQLEELLAAWRPFLSLQARGLLGDRLGARADTSDVVQETMTRAYRDFLRFRGTSQREWAAWLRSILRGQAGKMRRFHAAGRRSVAREGAAEDVEARGMHPPLEQMIALEQMAAIAAALELLPQAMQDVIYLRNFRHQSFEQVAQIMERSPGATRVLWSRAVQQLRSHLAAHSSAVSSHDNQ
jgi:RNA polymerase sigma-70 factor (ECF subfamily)